MTKLAELEAIIETNNLKQTIGIITNGNSQRFSVYIKNGSYVLFYGTYTQAVQWLKGFAAGLREGLRSSMH